MSGGSYNYLYKRLPESLFTEHDARQEILKILKESGNEDIARHIERLVAKWEDIAAQADDLFHVLHAVEWYESGDWSVHQMDHEIAKFRKEFKRK